MTLSEYAHNRRQRILLLERTLASLIELASIEAAQGSATWHRASKLATAVLYESLPTIPPET